MIASNALIAIIGSDPIESLEENPGIKWTLSSLDPGHRYYKEFYVSRLITRKKESLCHLFGPYEDIEIAKLKSGWPKPKTEVEDLWDLVRLLKDKMEVLGVIIPTQEGSHYREISVGAHREIIDRINDLRIKWKK